MGQQRSAVRGRVTVEERKGGRVYVASWIRANGRQTRKVLGPAWVRDSGKRTPRGAVVWRAAAGTKPDDTYVTPRDADDALQALLGAERSKPVEKRSTPGKTWGDAVDGWLQRAESVRDIAPTTLQNYRSIVSSLEGEGLPRSLPLRQVTPRLVEKVQRDLLARVDPSLKRKDGGIARKTVSNRMLVVQGVIGYAQGRGWIGADPTAGVELIGAPRPSVDFNVLEPSQVELVARTIAEVTDDELPRMRNGAVDEHALASARRARAMWSELVRVAAYTGLRFGELRALRWRDVDFAGEVVRVSQNLPSSSPKGAKARMPKSKKGRSVPLIAPAVAALDRVSRLGHADGEEDLVFPTLRGGMQDAGRVRDAFYEALTRAGLGRLRESARPIVLHDLRHTFGTIAVRVFPVTDVQAYLGHADIATTMRYVHHVPRSDAARRLTEAFSADLGEAVPAPTVRA
jgi:integrase